MQSNYGSGIPDLDGVDPGSESLSQDWNLELLEAELCCGTRMVVMEVGVHANGGEDSSKDLKARLCFIPAKRGHNGNNRNRRQSVAQLPQHTLQVTTAQPHTAALQRDLISQTTSPKLNTCTDIQGRHERQIKQRIHTPTGTKHSVRDAIL